MAEHRLDIAERDSAIERAARGEGDEQGLGTAGIAGGGGSGAMPRNWAAAVQRTKSQPIAARPATKASKGRSSKESRGRLARSVCAGSYSILLTHHLALCVAFSLAQLDGKLQQCLVTRLSGDRHVRPSRARRLGRGGADGGDGDLPALLDQSREQ